MLCSQFQMQLELSCTPTNHSRELCAVAQQADWLRDRLGDRNNGAALSAGWYCGWALNPGRPKSSPLPEPKYAQAV
jgi:hypothetical protein